MPSDHLKLSTSKSSEIPKQTTYNVSRGSLKFPSSHKYITNQPRHSTSINNKHKYINPNFVKVNQVVPMVTTSVAPVKKILKTPLLMSKHKLVRNVSSQHLTNSNSQYCASHLLAKSKPHTQASKSTSTTILKVSPTQNLQQLHSKTKFVKKYSVVNIDKTKTFTHETSKINAKPTVSQPANVTETYQKHSRHKWHKPSYISSNPNKIPILRRSRFTLIKKTASPLIVSFFFLKQNNQCFLVVLYQ